MICRKLIVTVARYTRRLRKVQGSRKCENKESREKGMSLEGLVSNGSELQIYNGRVVAELGVTVTLF